LETERNIGARLRTHGGRPRQSLCREMTLRANSRHDPSRAVDKNGPTYDAKSRDPATLQSPGGKIFARFDQFGAGTIGSATSATRLK